MANCIYLKIDPEVREGSLASPEERECEYQGSEAYRRQNAFEKHLTDWIIEHCQDCDKCPLKKEGE